jgi:hypothetical protein
MIRIIEQSLGKIKQITPAAAAPAPKPLAVIPPRAVNAQGWPVIVVEGAQSGPAAAPVGAHRHPARLKQVRDVNPLPQRCAEVIIWAVHETRIIVLRSAGTASGDGGAVVIKIVRNG